MTQGWRRYHVVLPLFPFLLLILPLMLLLVGGEVASTFLVLFHSTCI